MNLETDVGTAEPPLDRTDDVERHIASFAQRVEAAHDALIAALERDVASPLATIADSVLAEHDALLEQADLRDVASDERAREPDRDELWTRVRLYRRGCAERIIDPIRETLRAVDAGHTIAGRWREFEEALSSAARIAPQEIVRPEPEETYASAIGDSALVGARKRWVRLARRTGDVNRRAMNSLRRIARMDEQAGRVFEQTVPLRRLLEAHVTLRYRRSHARHLDALHQRIARPIARIEVDLGDALNQLLDIEHGLDAARHHDAVAASPQSDTADGQAEGESDLRSIQDRLRNVFTAVVVALTGLRVEDLLPALTRELAETFRDEQRELFRDVLRVGTFMLDPAEPSTAAPDATRVATTEAWIEWHRQAVARLDLGSDLSTFRDAIESAVDDFNAASRTGLEEGVLVPFASCAAAIRMLRDDVASACATARADTDAAGLRTRLAQTSDRATTALEEQLVKSALGTRLGADMVKSADAAVSRVGTALEAMAESLALHEPPEDDRLIDPHVRAVRVRPREVAEQAFDAIVLERVRTSHESLIVGVTLALEEVSRLESVIRFHLHSALEEIDPARDDVGAALAGAEELTLNGLDRTLESLAGQETALRAQRRTCTHALFNAVASGWELLHERIRVEDRMQEQILDVGYRMRVTLRSAVAQAVQRSQQASRVGARLLRIGRGRAEELVRKGQSAVAGERITEAEKRRTIDALSQLDEMLAALPLVYRRLFTFQPLQDPALLEGRSADIEVVRQHYKHWRIGLTDAFVVTGYDGNGRTSFLNVATQNGLGDAEIRRLRLEARVTDESELARVVAGMLQIANPPSTLDELATRLHASPAPARPVACLVENLEHLFLRTARDNGLIGRMLGFMSRTDSVVCWIATLADPAWSYVEKVEAATARLVRRHALTPMTRADLEAVISSRHARSGLGLDFQSPEPVPPMLRRRLSRAADDAERQRILRGEYFDQLARHAGQNILLAIFYWLRSIEPDAASSSVRVRPVEPLSFGYLTDFTLSQSFTLKAFLEHATLTLEEHDRIFDIDRSESRYLFESLGNLLLLEPADVRERVSEFTFTTVDDARRYRLRPLVVHPVLVHLRAKNLIL